MKFKAPKRHGSPKLWAMLLANEGTTVRFKNAVVMKLCKVAHPNKPGWSKTVALLNATKTLSKTQREEAWRLLRTIPAEGE
jgi:hypothetical protein